MKATLAWRLLQAGAWIVLAFLFVPLLVVIPVSLTDQSFLSFPRDGISFMHYVRVLSDPVWRHSIAVTGAVAAGAASLATLLGGLAAIACWRFPGNRSNFVRAMVVAPLVVPTIVSALGYYQLWARLGLLDTYTGVVIANTVQTLPYTFAAIAASLLLMDRRLEEAARNLGARQLTAIWTVLVPSAKPGILSGFLFAFVYAWDEVVVQLFITSRTVRLLPRLIWEGLQDTVDPAIAVISACLTLATALVLVVILVLQANFVGQTTKH